MVGSSPEPMVRLRDGVVISRPIAGSRPRGATDERGPAAGRASCSEDPKEVAEHVMLVDLARNDVGRVVTFGTEHGRRAHDRRAVQPHHAPDLAGDRASCADGRGPIDVLRATLPAGTLSGAPKVRAMEIIDELEPTKRGIYGGVVGYLDFSGNLDTAIAIRTMVVGPDGRASVQAGAGIVADSDPATEDEECAHKAAALLAAVAAARRMAAAPRAGRRDTRDAREADYRALRDGCGAYRLDRDVLSVAGPGRRRRTSRASAARTSAALAVGAAVDALVLEPDGKLDGPGPGDRGSPTTRFVVDVDGGFGDAVVARLARFKLRSKLDIEPLDWSCGRPPGAPGGADVPPVAGARRPRVAVRLERRGRDRPARPRCRVRSSPARRAPVVSATRRGRPCRIEAGIPAMGRELDGRTIAAEAGLVERTVSFTKGCYTGQELVARLDARGNRVARRLCGIVLGCPEDASPAGWSGPTSRSPAAARRWSAR